MAGKNLHAKPFDEGTIAKLEIFEDYAQAWIPTFVMLGAPTILIADFFAGTGYDKNGIPGSPIRLLEKLREQSSNLRSKKVKVIVYLNEYDRHKFEELKVACENFLEEASELAGSVDLRLRNEDFESLFETLLPEIKQYPSLVYLDQNGIKYLSSEYFLKLESAPRCDFLYFVSASYAWRFGSTEEFRGHLQIDLEEAKKNPYRFIHRSILEQLKKSLPASSKLKLYPFSIRKGSNIYGIIFGAKHPRAVEKFIGIAWKRDEESGEANFDINEDSKKDQLQLFGPQELKKVEAFQQRFEELVMNGTVKNNFDAFEYSLREAHPGRHAAEVLRRLKREHKVKYDSPSPLVTFEAVHKLRRKLNYEVVA